MHGRFHSELETVILITCEETLSKFYGPKLSFVVK